jgi:putative flavoprotein involved in K+ transport
MSAAPVDVAVVGAGQAALALAHALRPTRLRCVCLSADARVGDSWRRRWDSLRLFTPAQYDGLPGLPFPAPADTYPTRDAVADYLEGYAARFALPVETGVRVTRLGHDGGAFALTTTRGPLRARQVVLATGPCGAPRVPAFAERLPPTVVQLHAADYRRPGQLPDGPVVVVGGGASGVQIAAELAMTRPVTLCRGRRELVLPQRIGGRDIWYWLARTPDVAADSPLGRLLARSDPLVGEGPAGLQRRLGVPVRARAVDADAAGLRLADGATLPAAAVIWATGHAHRLDWIDLPVRDEHGRPRHRDGASPVPGLFFLGLRWMRHRGSSLLGWVGRDAAFIADRLLARA